MEAWVTLTALAQATNRIRIGTMVNGIIYRHPALLTKMASSLDIVSNGRLELGIGSGWNEEECDAYGIERGTWIERFAQRGPLRSCRIAGEVDLTSGRQYRARVVCVRRRSASPKSAATVRPGRASLHG